MALAGVLVRPSDLLILDEPTNHMDNETVAWLEEVLQKRKGALLMVTHDRYFFDRVVNRTLEIDGGEGYLYTGNYSLFLQKREERRIAAAGAAQRLRNVYRSELAWISRGAEARRTKSKERIERFNELKKEVNNIKTEQQLEISSVGSRLGKTIIECEHIGLDYGGKTYIDDFNYVLLRNDRIGIVGPNGSGKSNISDAVRWVLGEQSAKYLRGSKMEDVIFSGSSKRRALGVAEVTLNFDNSDHRLGLDFDEVSITRRVFRDGDSEYAINKKNCRLKDIIDLFADTGLGRGSLSIIGQNKIDEILNSRPEERRNLFEEAAGIVKYRLRKKDAARRLDDTAANLTRINDIKTEVESQLEPLKEAAAKTEQYNVLAGELRTCRLTQFVRKIDCLLYTSPSPRDA